jgi:hypothetical protein
MAEQLNLSINVTGNVEESLGSIKKQLREAQNEVTALSDKFGATSKEAVNAAKKAADLKDRIGDAKALTEAFNPDQKFRALTQSLAGVAGGFAAVQGAIGLFGGESKELEKQLLKVQSAMALSEGLEQVGNSIDSFKQLGTVIKTQVVTAFSTLRGALIATGIGALAIGIALIAANFDKVKKAVLNAVPGLETFANFVGKIITKVTDFVGITSVQDRGFQQLIKTTERANETIDQRIKLLTAQGGKEKEIYELNKQRNENELKILREKLKLTGQLSEEESKRFRELKNENAVLDLEEQGRLTKLQEKPNVVKDIVEKETKVQKDNSAEVARNVAKLQKEAQENSDKAAAKKQKDDDEEVERLFQQEEDLQQKNIKISNEKILLDKKNAQAAEIIAREKKESETMYAMQTLDIIGGLVDQNSVAGKAISISQAIINTYLGASKAIAQGGVFGPIAAAATIAAGLVNVQKIISTKVPSAKGRGTVGGGGGGGSISASSAAPIQPLGEQAQLTQLNQSSINAIGNQSMRAYVVETDVTSSQQRIAAIQQRARFN